MSSPSLASRRGDWQQARGFPFEALCDILLDDDNFSSSRLVCKSWAAGMAASRKRLTVRSVRDKGLSRLAAFPRVTALSLVGLQRPAELVHVGHLSNLIELTITGEVVTTDSFLLPSLILPALKFVDLGKLRGVTDDAAAAIACRLPVLASFTPSPDSTDVLLDAIGDSNLSSSLTRLDLRGCNKLTEEGMSNNLGRLTSLTSLTLNRKSDDNVLVALGHCSRITYLDLSSCDSISDTGLAALRLLPALSSLRLFCWNLGDAWAESLLGLSSLTSLSLLASDMDDVLLSRLAHLTVLTELTTTTSLNLTCNVSGITNAGLKHLSKLSVMKSLTADISIDLRLSNVSNDGLAHLGRLSSIRLLTGYVTLQTTSLLLTDHGLEHIGRLSGLTFLHIIDRHVLTNEGIANLRHLTSLSSLHLSSLHGVTDEGIAHLKHLTGLTSLALTKTPITDSGLEIFQHITALTSLDLSSSCNITGYGLANLSMMHHLTSLDLSACFNLRDIDHLRDLTSLSSLRLGSALDDDELSNLTRLTALTSLVIRGTEITDEGLYIFQHITGLTELDLSKSKKINGIGMAYLTFLPRLTSLDMRDCKNVHSEWRKIVAQLPSLKRLEADHDAYDTYPF